MIPYGVAHPLISLFQFRCFKSTNLSLLFALINSIAVSSDRWFKMCFFDCQMTNLSARPRFSNDYTLWLLQKKINVFLCKSTFRYLFYSSSGEGERDEIIIEAIPYDDLFVNVSAAEVSIENVTFAQVCYHLCGCDICCICRL